MGIEQDGPGNEPDDKIEQSGSGVDPSDNVEESVEPADQVTITPHIENNTVTGYTIGSETYQVGQEVFLGGDKSEGWHLHAVMNGEIFLQRGDSPQGAAVKPKIMSVQDFLAEQKTAKEGAGSDPLEVGDRALHQGDTVTVTRSSGEIENDWTLRSFGEQFVVVEKIGPGGEKLQKTIPLEVFRGWQR